MKVTKNRKENVDDFIYENQDISHSKLGKRKDVTMFKYLRFDKEILLFKECLEEEPMYIPRKFLNNKVYAMNKQEKNIYNKLVLKKFKTETEILAKRREHF